MTTVDLIFVWFGKRYNITYVKRFKKFFPEARVHLYTNLVDIDEDVFDEIHVVESPFDKNHPRYRWRCADYWKTRGMLESTADVAIALDGDMYVLNDKVRTIIPLARRFGICLPANPRLLVAVDQEIGADVDDEQDESLGQAHAFNCGLMAVSKHVPKMKLLLENWVKDKVHRPRRGPLMWWRACWSTGVMPCLLPPQWCLCAGSKAHHTIQYAGVGNEIVIHAGHDDARRQYGIKEAP